LHRFPPLPEPEAATGFPEVAAVKSTRRFTASFSSGNAPRTHKPVLPGRILSTEGSEETVEIAVWATLAYVASRNETDRKN
jgi:hypothetical protein